jgi:FSR family fosmidomycin resistance protein-like MFS transporter
MAHPLAGILADRLRRNYFVVFAPLMTGFFMSLIGWAESYWILVIFLALSGIGTSLFHPQAATLAGRLTSERPGFSMSIFGVGGSLGIAAGPLLIVPIVTTLGMRASLLAVLPALIVVFLTLPLLDRQVGPRISRPVQTHRPYTGRRFVLFLLYWMVVVRATTIITFQSFIPLFLSEREHSLMLGAIAVTVFQFSGAAGIVTGGWLSDRMNRRNLLAFSFLGTFPFSLLFLLIPAPWGILFLAPAALILFSSTPVNIVLGQQLFPENTSFVSGILMGFAWGVAGLLATPLGALSDKIGLFWMLLLVAATSLIGFFLTLLCPGQLFQSERSR